MSFLDNTGLTTFWNKIKALADSKANKADAIKTISRSGTTLTATRADNTTFTFTQRDNNTTYSAGTGLSMSDNTLAISAQAARNALGLGNTTSYLPVANGGTGTNSLSTMLANAGIRAGYVTFSKTTDYNTFYQDFTITFSPALSSVPVVLLQVNYTSSGSYDDGFLLSHPFQVYNASKTGFVIRYNGASQPQSSYAPKIYWIAFAF